MHLLAQNSLKQIPLLSLLLYIQIIFLESGNSILFRFLLSYLDQDPTEDINVESIDSATLKSVVSYCEHHNYTNPEPLRKPLPSNKLEDFLDAWDNEFVTGFDDDGLLNVVNAANFLDIKPLVDICLAKIACMFKGKSIEDLRKEYQIEQEFTPELEEEIKKEYPWAFEDDE